MLASSSFTDDHRRRLWAWQQQNGDWPKTQLSVHRSPLSTICRPPPSPAHTQTHTHKHTAIGTTRAGGQGDGARRGGVGGDGGPSLIMAPNKSYHCACLYPTRSFVKQCQIMSNTVTQWHTLLACSVQGAKLWSACVFPQSASAPTSRTDCAWERLGYNMHFLCGSFTLKYKSLHLGFSLHQTQRPLNEYKLALAAGWLFSFTDFLFVTHSIHTPQRNRKSN